MLLLEKTKGMIQLKTKEAQRILNEIILSLALAGYEPYEQLAGYIKTGSELYITRKGNAREKIKLLETSFIKEEIRKYNAAKAPYKI